MLAMATSQEAEVGLTFAHAAGTALETHFRVLCVPAVVGGNERRAVALARDVDGIEVVDEQGQPIDLGADYTDEDEPYD